MLSDPERLPEIGVIEVYPAATLKSHGLMPNGYKKPEDGQARMRLIDSLAQRIDLPADTTLMMQNADALDAVVCLVAGADFLFGSAMPPENHHSARKEGWIWARR